MNSQFRLVKLDIDKDAAGRGSAASSSPRFDPHVLRVLALKDKIECVYIAPG